MVCTILSLQSILNFISPTYKFSMLVVKLTYVVDLMVSFYPIFLMVFFVYRFHVFIHKLWRTFNFLWVIMIALKHKKPSPREDYIRSMSFKSKLNKGNGRSFTEKLSKEGQELSFKDSLLHYAIYF